MDVTVMMRKTWTFQTYLTDDDIPAIAFACQQMIEDSGIEDEDGYLTASQIGRIEKEFPKSAGNGCFIQGVASGVMEQIANMFGEIAKR